MSQPVFVPPPQGFSLKTYVGCYVGVFPRLSALVLFGIALTGGVSFSVQQSGASFLSGLAASLWYLLAGLSLKMMLVGALHDRLFNFPRHGLMIAFLTVLCMAAAAPFGFYALGAN